MATKRRWKWPLRILKGVLVLCVLLFLLWLFRFPLFGGLIRDEIAAALANEGFEVEIGEISGSLLADVEVRDIKVHSGPKLESAEIARISADYSLFGLISGGSDWIGDIRIEGLQAVADLDLPVPPEPPVESEETPGDPSPIPVPRSVRIDGLDLVVLTGENRLELRAGMLHTDRSGSAALTGLFGAESLVLLVDGDEHVADAPRGTISFADGVLSVPDLTVNGHRHDNVLRADLAAVDRDELSLDLHFPLFSGRIDIEAQANLSGEFPEGSASVVLHNLDLRPLLRFAPDLPVVPGRIDATVNVSTPRDREPSLETVSGDYRLAINRIDVEKRVLTGIDLHGEVAEGLLSLAGTVASLNLEIEGSLGLLADDPPLTALLVVADLDVDEFQLELEGQPVLGNIAKLELAGSGTLSTPTLQLALDEAGVRCGRYAATLVNLRASGTPDRVQVDTMLRLGEGETVMASAAILPGEPLRFEHAEFKLRVDELAELRALLPVELPRDLAGRLEVEIVSPAGTPEAPNATVRIAGRDIVAEGHRLRELRVDAGIPTPDSVELREFFAAGEGSLPTIRVLDADLQIVEGAEFPGVTAQSFSITGHGLRLQNEGAISLSPLGVVEADLVLEQRDNDALLSQLPSEVPFGFDFEGGRVTLQGAWPEMRATVEMKARELWIHPRGSERIEANTARLAASFAEKTLSLSELSVRARDWSLAGKGRVPFDPEDPPASDDLPLDAQFDITDVPLTLIGAAAGLPLEAGTLDVHAGVSGTPALPRAVGSIEISDGVLGPLEPGLPRIDGLALDLGFSAAGTESADFELRRIVAETMGAALLVEDGRLSRANGIWRDHQLALSLRGLDLQQLEGILGGPLPATGVIEEVALAVTPEPAILLTVNGVGLRFEQMDPLDLELAARWGGGFLSVDTCTLGAGSRRVVLESARIPIELDFGALTATVPQDAPIAARLTSRLDDIAAVIPPNPDLRASGGVSLELTAAGTLASPTASILATLEKLRVRSPGAPPLDNFSGKIAMSLAKSPSGLEQTIEVRELKGLLGGGPFGVSGTVEARDGVIGVSDLRVTGENALLVQEEGLRLRSDLNLVLRTNSLDDILLEGEVKIRNLRYTQDVDFLDSGPSPAPLPLSQDPFLAKLKLKVAVLMPEDSVRIRNNVIEADLVGRLDVVGTAAVPRPKGRVRILNGELYLPTATMKIPRAAVELREEYPLRPFVDAKATARIAGHDVVADATGPADRLKIELSSNPTLTRPNIVSLLTTGVVWDNVGAKSLSSMAATVFAKQLASSLGSNDGEESDLDEFIGRFEFDVDEMTATFQIEDWLFLRGSQDDPVNFGLDLLFRLAFK